jgi:hypothetical protein
MCRKRVLPGQILTAAIWKPPLESEHRMPTLCPEPPSKIKCQMFLLSYGIVNPKLTDV